MYGKNCQKGILWEYKIPEFKEYKEIIADKLSVDIKNVVPDAEFIQDLGADSLDTVVILQDFEEMYGINVPDYEAEKLLTVQEAFDYLKNKVRQKIEDEGKILEAYLNEKAGKTPDFGEYIEVITETLGVHEDEVKEDASFADDLGADSLDTVKLIQTFEEVYGIKIPSSDAERLTTVKKGLDYLRKEVRQKMMREGKIWLKMGEVIVERLVVGKEKIKFPASFADDLGKDSHDHAELMMALEDEFDVEIPDEDAEKLTTVGKTFDYLNKKDISKYILENM